MLFDRQDSKYPYAASGEFPLPGGADWLDPFITLTFAAAVTKRFGWRREFAWCRSTIRSCWRKQSRAWISLSGGRFALGVGIGWSAEEFAALGIPFERRAQRTREYIEVMRLLWSVDATSFHGEFVNFDAAKSFPKPARARATADNFRRRERACVEAHRGYREWMVWIQRRAR